MFRKIAILTFMCTLVLSGPVRADSTDWWGTAQKVLPTTTVNPAAHLSSRDMSGALRDALRLGTEQVVQQLGRPDGFNHDPRIHIPLPRPLQTVDKYLGKLGMSSLGDDLELRLNRAAEAATPRARDLFIKAIRDMTFTDARAIVTGPNDAATIYLRRVMGPDLAKDMSPIVAQTLNHVGAIRALNQMQARYHTLPFAPKIDTDLNDYVVNKALDGIFYYVAQQEAAIRSDPARQSTVLLKRVFGVMINR